MTKLKLYVWAEFEPNYTDGLAFAIAETEDEARSLVIERMAHNLIDWGPVEIMDISKCVYYVVGS